MTVTINLREGEHVRVAAGPGFIRFEHGTRYADIEKARALDMAVSAGIMTEAEAQQKRREHGMLASRSHIISMPDARSPAMGLDRIAQNALDSIAADVRGRVISRTAVSDDGRGSS
jgi:hypothetical protein